MKNPFNIGVFDFETDPFKRGREPKPFAADVFADGVHTTWWSPDCAASLVLFLLKSPPRIWYAHNGGKFDFHLIIELLPRKLISKILCIGGRIVQLKFENGMELRDSFALIPRGLREWAKEDINYEKLESEVRETHKTEIIRYLKKDTDYLSEMLHAFIETYGLHLTLASAAFKILHKNFSVPRKRISESMDARFRRWYFAGRVEFYQLGELAGNYTCVDVNSSFPWSMTQDHWEGSEYYASADLPTQHLEQSFIRTVCESRGAFPFRNENGSVSFPDDGGEREFFVTGWEWVAAMDLGLLVNARVISCYTPASVRNYSDYINYFYKIKSEAESSGNKGERLFAKLLMNSGYGKFGMDPREHEEVSLRNYRDRPDGDGWSILKDDEATGITIYKRPARGGRDRFNNVCVAASITGCSRALLLRAREKCRGVVYCDTDSLIARDVSQLPTGPGLGQWKVENEFDQFFIGGKKLYAGHDKNTGKWKTACKGARLTPEQIIKVARGEVVEFEFDAPSYSIRSIKPHNEGGKPGATKWLRFTKRKIRRADQQGKVQKSELPKPVKSKKSASPKMPKMPSTGVARKSPRKRGVGHTQNKRKTPGNLDV